MRRQFSILCGTLFFAHALFGQTIPVACFSDSSKTYVVHDSKDLALPAIISYLRKIPLKKKIALKALQDSLGFFSPSFAPKNADTTDVIMGNRTIVENVVITVAVLLSTDSISTVKFPRPYDRGEIEAMAKQCIAFLGQRGYPFASLSISILPLSVPGRVSIVFDVRDNGKHAFAKPLFLGPISTSRRLLEHDVAFKENDVFDIRKVYQTQSRLLLRPYIVSVTPMSPSVLLEAQLGPNTTPLDKVLAPFYCQDQKGLGLDGAITFSAGGSSATTSLLGIVNISLLNLLHGGESGEVSYNGQKDYSKLAFSLAKPYLFDLPIHVSGDFSLEIQAEENGYLRGGLEGLTDIASDWQLGLSLNGHEVWDTSGTASEYVGVDILLKKPRQRLMANTFSQGMSIRTGSGYARNFGRQFDRYNVEISGDVQVPFFIHQAVYFGAIGKSIFTHPDDSLQTPELYRTGGYQSVRGYSDNEFAFKTVAYCQLDYLFYFTKEGAVYAFTDAGAGFGQGGQLTLSDATILFGYGIGLRIPVAIGTATLEWARNYTDTQSFGRIHVSIQNPISAALGR